MNGKRLRSFNIYDIFANIVPGVVFLIGLSVPFELQQIFGDGANAAIGVTLFLFFSLVVGQILQAIGGWADGDHGFSLLVEDIVRERNDSRFDVTEFDEYFLVLCQDTFGLSDEFDDYSRLFKLLLAYLEYSGRSRALRMQALYLLARGVWVSAGLLIVWFVTLLISFEYGYVTAPSLESVSLRMADFRSTTELLIALSVSTVVGAVFTRIRNELEADWISYAITEFYLDAVTLQKYRQNTHNPQL
jgi:hypothetical protein